jgi:hypothetical protein
MTSVTKVHLGEQQHNDLTLGQQLVIGDLFLNFD